MHLDSSCLCSFNMWVLIHGSLELLNAEQNETVLLKLLLHVCILFQLSRHWGKPVAMGESMVAPEAFLVWGSAESSESVHL